jgi:hypothetical protein
VVLQEQATNEPSNQVQEKTLGGASDRDKWHGLQLSADKSVTKVFARTF